MPSARANHGPGTSGGGSFTVSGETLRAGGFDLTLRTDVTQFDDVSRAEAEAKAVTSGEFDALDHSVLQTISLAYGLSDDLQLGAVIGYYWGTDFIDAEEDGMGGAESSVGDPDGITDLWLTGKYRVMRGASGHLSLIAGIKLPTGVDDETLSNGEVLEPSSQPGTGAVDYQAGAAYSRYLSSRMTLDASVLHTFRTEHDDFQVGDRTDFGVALAYRLTESVKSFPNMSVSTEILAVWLGKDEEDSVKNENSGGDTYFVAPGVRCRVNENLAIGLSAAFPVSQDLNGEQIETSSKAGLTVDVSF